MALYNKGSGRSANRLADQRRFKINLILKGMIVVFGFFVIFVLSGGWKTGLFVIVPVGFIFIKLMKYFESEVRATRKREKHALRGAKGEDNISDILSNLSNDYLVLNDVETKQGDIDHVVISKQGAVFVIETKAHGGKVTFEGGKIFINGKNPEKNFIGQTLRNAYLIRDDIKELTGKIVWVNAILCFTNAFVDHHKAIRGVQVLNKKFLLRYIERNKPRYPVPEIWEKMKLR